MELSRVLGHVQLIYSFLFLFLNFVMGTARTLVACDYHISCPNTACIIQVSNDNLYLRLRTPENFFTEALKIVFIKSPCQEQMTDRILQSKKHRYDKGEELLKKITLPCDGFYQVKVKPSSTYMHKDGRRLHGCKDAHSPAAFFNFTWNRRARVSRAQQPPLPAALTKPQASWHLPVIVSSVSLLVVVTAIPCLVVTLKKVRTQRLILV